MVSRDTLVRICQHRFPACMLVTSSRDWIIRWSRCWRQTAAGIDDSPGTTRSAKWSTVQVIDFPLLVNRGVYPCFEQRRWSNETAGVSSSTRTVTNRSKSWTKTRASSFICTFPCHGSIPLSGFWSFSAKYPFHLSINLSCSALYIFAKFHAVLLSQSTYHEVSASVILQNRARKDFAREVHFFGVIPSDCPFLSRIKFCTRCILRISGVSRRSVQSQFFNFP